MRPWVADGLERALSYGGDTHTLGDVLRALLAGEAFLHESEDAAIVTELHRFPRGTVLHFWLATGKLEAVIELSRHVMACAKAAGIEEATFQGRRGWEKVLAAEGWTREPMVLMRRKL